MALPKSGIRVKRWSVVGMEGMWAKMFDPPTESPATPDNLSPNNPVPEVMLSKGYLSQVSTPHTVERDLMHGLNIPTWDNRTGGMMFFLIRDADNPLAVGTFPGPTVRVPRGVVFHAHTKGHGPPPHTIHWHGLEPTPMNDGVGHCSMEIGDYTYQFQPNFIGSYFYHCHRNTVQHFEFGLYGFLVVEPPDAYWATLKDPTIPIGHCRPEPGFPKGRRRTAANLTGFPQFADAFRGGDITDPDPENPNPAVADPANLRFRTDPHAMTVAYDLEALWVFDDRDSVWSDMAPDARATYPRFGNTPGVDDEFDRNPGKNGFFAFNDFRPDYFYVTGVPVPAHRLDKGGTGEGVIPTGVVIPAELNSGVSGTQVPVSANVGDTVLLRCLNGAYACVEITFPVETTVIAWDGRALGVPPYGQYNHAYTIPANTPFRTSVARRFDALIRSDSVVDSFATVKFINTRGEMGGVNSKNFDIFPLDARPANGPGGTLEAGEEVLMTARIPIQIGVVAPVTVTSGISGTVTGSTGAPVAGVTIDVETMSLGGGAHKTAVTDASGNYSVTGLSDGMYQITPSLNGVAFAPIMDPATGMPGRTVTLNGQNVTGQNFTASAAAGISVSLSANKQSPQPPNTPGGVTFSAQVSGGSGQYEYQFKLNGTKVRDYATTASWTWGTAAAAMGAYTVQVSARPVGVPLAEQSATVAYTLAPVVPTSATTNIADDYTLEECLNSLKMAVGTRNPTLADLQRYDVAPLVNGIQQLDGRIDLQDVLVMLRRHLGLPL